MAKLVMEVPQNWNQSCERPEEKGVCPENLHRFCIVLLKSTLFLTGEGVFTCLS